MELRVRTHPDMRGQRAGRPEPAPSRRLGILVCSGLALLALVACQPSDVPTAAATPTRAEPTRTPPPPATPIPTIRSVPEQAGLELSQERGRYFAASGVCSLCHQYMLDDAGTDVSIAGHWRSSMMANSARDPFWQASLVRELRDQPDQTAEVEAMCAGCHMPMASFTDLAHGNQPAILGDGYLSSNNPLHDLAMDGVSCTLCHQIREEGLGFRESYNGGFAVDTELEPGRRVLFGPYTIDDDQSQIMETASGYVPTQGLHLAQSELCGTCHTFFVPGSDLPVQTTYLEWYYSSHRRSDTCQDCHMPDAEGGVRIADTSPFPRSPFAQHSLQGGNAYMLGLFSAAVEELGLTASANQFDGSRQAGQEFLAGLTANLELEEVRLSGSRLTVDVALENLSGHKFPTGFPSRRAWIRFWVEDANGQTVFESGGYDSNGLILQDDGDRDPSTFEQHYQAIVQPEQVQIYEAILEDADGRPGTGLLSASGYLKDNRLLPAGYDPLRAVESIQVHGHAVDDPDFGAGGDRIQYSMDLGDAPGPFSVGVELLYQSVGARWMADLNGVDHPLVSQFLGLVERVPNTPLVVARRVVTAGE